MLSEDHLESSECRSNRGAIKTRIILARTQPVEKSLLGDYNFGESIELIKCIAFTTLVIFN